jgi:hypothetical protein
MAGFYKGIAAFYPDHVFSQYTSEHNAVQQRYFRANARTASPPSFESALDASLNEIHAGVPNFRSYVAPGIRSEATPLHHAAGRFLHPASQRRALPGLGSRPGGGQACSGRALRRLLTYDFKQKMVV